MALRISVALTTELRSLSTIRWLPIMCASSLPNASASTKSPKIGVEEDCVKITRELDAVQTP